MMDRGVLPNVGVCRLATQLCGARRNVQDFPGSIGEWSGRRFDWGCRHLRSHNICSEWVIPASQTRRRISPNSFFSWTHPLQYEPFILDKWEVNLHIMSEFWNWNKGSTDLFLVWLPWHFCSKVFLDFWISLCLVLNKKTYCTLILWILIFGIVCLDALSELEIYCTQCRPNTWGSVVCLSLWRTD